MADGSDGTDVSPESEATAVAEKGGEIWGTLEELLLACAVTRHGTASWDSVAMEVQTRSPVAARPGLTPHSCRLRFRHLHRRFSTAGSGGEEDEVEEDPDASAAEGWVDELRRLRVAELRRDVERCDLSIGSLQSKVKRLREERERSVSGEAKPDEASGNDRLSGEEPGRSCRESNSTDLKPPKLPGHQGGGAKEEVAKQEASGESAAAASKESSDVRSSASLCRRRRGSASGKADEEEAASAPGPLPARSPPLAALLDAVAAKLGSVLQRLHEHEGEEAAAYRGTIRRHVDLETVRRRLDTSAGSRADDEDHYPAHELYRDLLLLCTNAVVFFPRGAPEHAAAVESRALVTGHASASVALREPKQERVAAPATAMAPPGVDIVGSLIEKGKKPLIVCRKRSSIAKAAAAARKEEESSAAKVAEAEAEEGESGDEKKAVVATSRDKAWGLRTKKKGRGGAVRNPAALGLRPMSLRRFSCVSRAWRALISDPANRRRFAQTLSGLFFSRPSCSRPRWGFFTGLSAPPPPGVDTALSFLPPTCGEVELLDSCNGLLLLRCAGAPESPSPPFYVVCNPATGEHVALPQPSRAPGLNDGITDTYSAALGFDPAVSSNFHVFQLLQEHCLDLSLFIVAVEIYSSETGTWVFKESGWSEDDTRFNGQMTYFNGSLHFCNVSNAVVSVDTKGQAWRVSRVRHDAAYYGYGSSIGHSQGRLIYVAHNDSWSSSLSVYVLEDHDSEEWMWTFKQDIKKLDLFGPRSREWEYYIAGFHPNDDLVFFYFWPQKRLLSYNMKHGDVRVICTLREVLKLVHEGCFDLRRLFLPYVPLYSGALSARNASQPSAQGSNLASISLEGADELN